MSIRVQHRHGNASQVSGYTGPVGEVILNDTNPNIHMQNGVNAGGVVLSGPTSVPIPGITSPSHTATDVAVDVTLQASAFYGNDTHASTDWQIATDSNFTTIVHESLNDAVNLTQYPLGAATFTLSTNTQYFVRLRYRDTTGTVSAYSTIISFTTGAVGVFGTKTALFAGTEENVNARLGRNVSINDAGTLALVGASDSNVGGTSTGAGRTYLLEKSNGSWTILETFTQSSHGSIGTVTANSAFGRFVEISPNGEFIAIAAPEEPTGTNLKGAVYVYRNISGTWTFITRLTNQDEHSTHGEGILFNAAGTRLFIAVLGAGSLVTGYVHVLDWNGSTFVTQGQINNPRGSVGDYFGRAMACNTAGTILAIGTPGYNATVSSGGAFYMASYSSGWNISVAYDLNNIQSSQMGISLDMARDASRLVVGRLGGTSNDGGAAYVFTLDSAALPVATLEDTLTIASQEAGDNFGYATSISSDGTLIALSAANWDTTATDTGVVVTFTYSGGNWSQSGVQLFGSDANNAHFGNSLDMTPDGVSLLVGESIGVTSGGATGQAYIFD